MNVFLYMTDTFQKTYQEMAEEKKLHVVEIRSETQFFPKVLASPTVCKSLEEAKEDPLLDYHQYVFEGNVVLKRPRKILFYERLPSWGNRLKKIANSRNFDQVNI